MSLGPTVHALAIRLQATPQSFTMTVLVAV
jgi:hypothetical protein